MRWAGPAGSNLFGGGRSPRGGLRRPWYDPGDMPPRLPELVGRAMVDPEFLAELQRVPEAVLAGYELNDDERAAVRAALARLAHTARGEHAQVLRTALLRRVST